jgi:hypothetical protein
MSGCDGAGVGPGSRQFREAVRPYILINMYEHFYFDPHVRAKYFP